MIIAGNWHHAPTRSCSHPHCRTSLDEYPTECPHGLPFCEHCTWEEACNQCGLESMKTIWDAAGDSRPPMTTADEWAGHWGEQRKDERTLPHADPRMDDRAADAYYEKRWGA